ncbi:hypothetical protein ACPV5V_22565, partial [Vibrio campbellii]
MKLNKTLIALSMVSSLPVLAAGGSKPVGDITAYGKPASEHTIQANHTFAESLDFADVDAFANNDKGLIVPLTNETRKSLSDRFSHLHKGQSIAANAPDTVNPSLWRQAQLNHSAD